MIAPCLAGLDGGSPSSDAGRDASVAAEPSAVQWDPAQRSVRVHRVGELARVEPRPDAPVRGTLEVGSRFAVLEAVAAPGCRRPWARVATDAWVCTDHVRASAEAPAARALPVLAPDAGGLPFRYARPRRDGTSLWRTRADVGDDDRAIALRRDNTLAIREVLADGRARLAVTTDGRFVYERDLDFIRPIATSASGTRVATGAPATAVAFSLRATRAWPAAALALTGTSANRPREVAARTALLVREARTVRGVEVLLTERGWARATDFARASTGDLPADLQPNERWLDVDRASQIAVAYEGATPQWAALVSTGRAGHSTSAGMFRVRSKLAWDDMTNVGSGAGRDELYFVGAVPWVQYFHGGQALHAAFWHDDFGAVRSHGCVNLAPADARWLFEWAPPTLPAGFINVTATARDPGLRVRVR